MSDLPPLGPDTTAADEAAPDGPVPDEAAPHELAPDELAPDDAAVLGALEADLAAVESALASLDRIAAEGVGGEAAAAEIAAIVSPERFPVADIDAAADGDAG